MIKMVNSSGAVCYIYKGDYHMLIDYGTYLDPVSVVRVLEDGYTLLTQYEYMCIPHLTVLRDKLIGLGYTQFDEYKDNLNELLDGCELF